MTKPISKRLHPLRDTLLLKREAEQTKGAELAIVGKDPSTGKQVVKSAKRAAFNRFTVVAVGPGEWQNGVFVKPDERLQPGVSVLVAAYATFDDAPEIDREGLVFASWEHVLFIYELDVESKKAISA